MADDELDPSEPMYARDTEALDATLGRDTTFASEVSWRPSASPLELEEGARIGRYLVIRKLGAGAMGVVYAAYDPKLDRKVALKLIKGLDASDGARRRLEREAQALAQLADPHVVGVYDVDAHEDQLFVAMEFIEGGTLGAWMKQPRPWRAVLDKFMSAGRGLAAAHAAGLVHRDFKPDNVMLGEDGRVRVMDFGLARVDEELTTREVGSPSPTLATSLTQTGAVMGTPAYMAPEQYGGEADARSDQFGFCVALYEGLYGQRPFAAKTFAALMGATLAGEIGAAPRGTTVPAWLRAVVVRGLSAEPAERWPSMAALLDALADDPAQRRRRWAAGVMVVGLLAGVGGGGFWAAQRQAQTCRGFEARLADVWDGPRKAQVQAAFEATGASYAADTWSRVQPRLDAYTAGWLTARREACEAHQGGEQSGELLDLRMRCLDERLQHVEATVTILGKADEGVVRNAVEAVAGLPGLDRCADERALRAELPPPDNPDVAQRVTALDELLVEAEALRRLGSYARGHELATTTLEEALTLDYEPLHARAGLVAGAFEMQMGAYEQAEALLERAFASAVGLGMKGEAAETAAALVDVVGVKQARHEAGRGWAKSAEPLARAVGTPEARARYLRNLGLVAKEEGKYERARAHHEEALALLEEALGPDHPDVADSLNSLGILAYREGKYERARAHWEPALAIFEELLGPDHPHVADLLTNLGNVAKAEGKYEQARAHYERALAIMVEALGPEHPKLASPLTNLGNVAKAAGEYERARAYHERVLTIFEKALSPDHPLVALALNNLGEVAYAEGKYEQARAHHERALAIREKALDPDHPYLAYSLTGLGQALTSLDAPADAIVYLERALTLRATHEGDPTDLAKTRFALACALWDAPVDGGRDRPRARELAKQADRAYATAGDKASGELSEVRDWLAAHGP